MIFHKNRNKQTIQTLTLENQVKYFLNNLISIEDNIKRNNQYLTNFNKIKKIIDWLIFYEDFSLFFSFFFDLFYLNHLYLIS